MSEAQTGTLEGKVAFLTGAGAGIGRATAVGLATRGADIAFLTRTEANAERTRSEVEQQGRRVVSMCGDVGRAEDLDAALQRAVDELGRLDIVVANAGIEVSGTVLDTSVEDWERIVATNLSGVFYTTKYATPHLLAGGGGSIVIIGSDSSVWGSQGFAAYTTVKHGLIGLTRCMALDFGPQGIRTNIVCPTFVKTEMLEVFAKEHPDLADLWLSLIPLGRAASPEEVVSVVAHLSSDDARFTNGLVYTLDGGSTAGMFRPESETA
jgi:meso-butanediol dehydrogenase / (S,S)-butanediol dehydrogenase / diacetyl reductase